ncbi:glycoside hydrolase family 104 protein [Vreelandella malpeensis]|uniref:Glycoside hydrolase family 104 protein n=1 Tax=Vreelandella malpeensis TaxID=1172368 RepID=A0ABS8DUD7_9GAMM|nr:glycoside hydrolase family 104 protein [Halomonas malpeensis]MCB8889946.1 glycoside hydrolase family 104 protein [Halomonas malpeensis]
MPVISPAHAGGVNVCAFLDMIAFAELHTPMLNDPRTDNGYRIIVGSLPSRLILMDSYDDHPRQLVQIRKGLSSTAAGRYQILSRFWDHYRKTLALPDFGPLSQDRYAIQQLREQRALPLIQEGRIKEAIARCANIWASMPGAGYGQHEHTVERLLKEYQRARGVLCDDDRTWYERALLKRRTA